MVYLGPCHAPHTKVYMEMSLSYWEEGILVSFSHLSFACFPTKNLETFHEQLPGKTPILVIGCPHVALDSRARKVQPACQI